ncbi:hypothetical protein ANO14919_093170 [Xylariales sp. No.14919]|nr:hypothetical protein ANO14919_093170 [Xylariales sp. No.14919]
MMGLGRHILTNQSAQGDGLAYMLVGGVSRVSTVAEVGVDEGSLLVEPINLSHGYQCYVCCTGYADSTQRAPADDPPYSKNDMSTCRRTYRLRYEVVVNQVDGDATRGS